MLLACTCSDAYVYDSRNSCNAIIETKSNKLVIGCQKSVIPNTVTTIGNSAFSDCTNLSSIQIPNSVTTIEAYAFYGCRGLKTLEIPSSVKTIGYLAFHICESLTSITCYPTTPPTLGERAFDATNDSPIYVPSQSLNAYITATNWSAYANRIKAIQ